MVNGELFLLLLEIVAHFPGYFLCGRSDFPVPSEADPIDLEKKTRACAETGPGQALGPGAESWCLQELREESFVIER